MNAPVTPARAALHDLIATMQQLANLQARTKGRDLNEAEDRLYAQLEKRIGGLERQLQREVQERLGVDYAVLWHAVTPSGPIPKLPL